MKNLFKIMTVFLIIFMIACPSISVFAEIPENNGLGTPLAVSGVTKNISATANSTGTNKNWLNAEAVELTDTLFDSAFRISSIGTDAVPSTNQIRITFDSPAMTAGEYVYVSFYYRALSECNGVTYENKPVSFACTSLNMSSGLKAASNGTTYQSAENFDTWYKVSYTYPLASDVAEGSRYMQISFSKPADFLPAYCMEIAGVNILYFGSVTGQSSELIQNEISQTLKTAEFSSLTLDGENIDLTLYPTGYTKSILWNGEQLPAVEAKDMYGRDAEVRYSDDKLPADVTVTAFSYEYDFTSPDDSLKSTYTLRLDYVKSGTVTLVGTNETSSLEECTGGETVTARPTFYNPNGEIQNYVVVLGIYKGNKCMLAVPWNYTVNSDKTADTQDFSYTLPDGDYSGAELRVFVISPLKAIKVN